MSESLFTKFKNLEALIPQDDNMTVLAVVALCSAIATWIETTQWGRKVSSIVWAIVLGLLLANLKILPHDSTIYNIISGNLLNLAIPLLLFKANLKKIFTESGTMMIAFLIGAFGTILGVVLGANILTFDEQVNAQLTGMFTATYIGGSMNFLAVGKMVGIEEGLLATASAADQIAGLILFITIALAPSQKLVRKFFPSKIIETERHEIESPQENTNLIPIHHIIYGVALAGTICASGILLANFLNYLIPGYNIHKYHLLITTTLSIAVANFFPKQCEKLKGDIEVGTYIMLLYFVYIGAHSNLFDLFSKAWILIAFASIIVTVHLIVLLIGTKLFKIDLAESLVASNACIWGPGSAAAFAGGQGWKSLVTPSILCGLFGYVIANFLGKIAYETIIPFLN